MQRAERSVVRRPAPREARARPRDRHARLRDHARPGASSSRGARRAGRCRRSRASCSEAAPGEQSRRIDAAWRAYLRDWSIPLVSRARSTTAPRRRSRRGEGKRRVDRISALVDPFIASQMRVSRAPRAVVSRGPSTGRACAASPASRSRVLLFALMRRLRPAAGGRCRCGGSSTAHARIAAGEQDVEVPEEGAGEVGHARDAHSTRCRARSRATQSSLAAQNDDLERLANVLRAVLDSTVDGILLSDADGNVQLANRPVVALTRDLGMSYEGPVVDRLLSVERPHARPGRLPRGDGAAAREPRRADLRRVRGRASRSRLPGLHRTGARRPRRLPRPDLDAARSDASSASSTG